MVRVSGKTSVGGRRMVIRLLTPTVVGVILWEATGSVKNGKISVHGGDVLGLNNRRLHAWWCRSVILKLLSDR